MMITILGWDGEEMRVRGPVVSARAMARVQRANPGGWRSATGPRGPMMGCEIHPDGRYEFEYPDYWDGEEPD
jgi:hypothetical protein